MAFGGFGSLMQGGGQFSGPVGLAHARDPRYAMALALADKAGDTSPIASPWQGASRMAQGALAGWMMGNTQQEYKTREAAYQKAMADALAAGQGTPAVTQGPLDPNAMGPPQMITPAVPGDMSKMASILGGNKDTAGMAMNMQLQQLAAQQAAAQQLAQYQAMTPLEAERARAMTGPKVEEQRALIPGVVQQAGQVAGATAGATLPFDIAKAGGTEAARLAAGNAPTAFAGPTGPAIAPASAVADIAKAGPVAEAQSIAQAPGKAFDRSNVLRDEYNTLTKDFRTVQDAYSKIKSTSDTGAGDMSLLYSYVKLLDPGSVVRESEFATAAASGALGERIQGLVQRVVTGERLPASLREAFKSEAESLYQAQKGGAERLRTQYSDLATRYGLKPEDVIQDYTAQSGPVAGAPDRAAIEAEMRRRGLLK